MLSGCGREYEAPIQMEADVESYGPRAMADQDVCVAIGEDLTQHYPGYIWNVGCNHEAGVAYIMLVIPSGPDNQSKGFLIHLDTVLGPGGQKRCRWAAGEILERWGLPRDRAPADTVQRANENGLDQSSMVLKSRY